MQINVSCGEGTLTPAMESHVTDRVNHALKHVAPRVTRVEVHLRDDKQQRHGPDDKRCVMEARIAGKKPLVVSDKTDDLYEAVRLAAEKLGRAVTRSIERTED